ncbi:aldo/keto reductase [Pantanalinema rosaneae CENA516]|uniref:aldo/keto reductase n=1 Tax=Pantanalinema rosaneae TaxID=1620701 RepID=UPI003D6E9EB3
MEYRTLGCTGLKVSAIGVGTWQLSGPLSLDGQADGYADVGRESAIRLIHACEEFGINYIDSAELYGAGEGERRTGAALQGRRDRWVISTKFGYRQGDQGERITDCRPNTIRTSLEGSLQRLQTDYIDIYLYHTPPETAWIAEGKAVLDTLKQEGKIRAYGISTDRPADLMHLVHQEAAEVVMFARSLLLEPVSMLKYVQAHNLGTIVRGAFANGLLSGKYFRQRPQLSDQDIRSHWLNTVNTERYQIYEQFVPPGYPMSALALRYLLDFETTHTIVLGSKTIAEYQDALKALELPPLDASTHTTLTKIQQQFANPSFKQRVVNKLKTFLGR